MNQKEYADSRKQELKDQITSATGTKYDGYGIYAIYINHILVYIGKSRDAKNRIAEHMFHIEEGDPAHKYQILKEAWDRGFTITFDLLEHCKDDQELGFAEGRWIREKRPPLNYQIPKEEDYRKYDVNKQAKTISLAFILEQGGYYYD